jgi:N-acylneuraminate cytidylyltransferase
MKRTFAFIFARGGSKGLPGKNIKLLAGKPLIAYGISLALKMDSVERVFVSTDSRSIADIAECCGAEVIERPESLATDIASEWDAWQHAVNYVRGRGLDFDIFLSLPATSPLRNEDDVDRCLEALNDSTDIVITVTPSARNPYFNMVSPDEEGYAKLLIGNGSFKRRQDIPPVFDMTTVAYVSRPEFILKHRQLFQGRVRQVVIPKERSIDIDDEFDFKFAQALLQS